MTPKDSKKSRVQCQWSMLHMEGKPAKVLRPNMLAIVPESNFSLSPNVGYSWHKCFCDVLKWLSHNLFGLLSTFHAVEVRAKAMVQHGRHHSSCTHLHGARCTKWNGLFAQPLLEDTAVPLVTCVGLRFQRQLLNAVS